MGEGGAGILRRILRAAPTAPAEGPAPEPALTPARALRLAFARAADRAAGLVVAVLGVAEEVAPLDDLLGRLEPDLLILAIDRNMPRLDPCDHIRPAGPVGFVAFDSEARAAVVEAQTLGRPAVQVSESRDPTAADLALSRPLAQALLDEAATATAGTALDGWVGRARAGDRLPSAREAALTLPDGSYRAVRLTLDLGAGGRQGLCVLLLPVTLRSVAPIRPIGDAWREDLARQVMAAPSEVVAVLHRLRVPLSLADGLDPGQVLPLPGVTVASVRLEGPGGVDLGPARLGQAAGMRAIRLEVQRAPLMSELAPLVGTPLGIVTALSAGDPDA